MRKAPIVAGVVVIGAVGVLWLVRSQSQNAETLDRLPTQSAQASPSATVVGAINAAPVLAPAAPKRAKGSLSRDMLVKRLKERFGDELQLEFGPDGRLVSIRGSNSGRRASTDFRPEDPQKAIARAKEVINATRDLIGVESDWSLEHPVARGNAMSAQVYFHQGRDGVPISPEGEIRVDLGSEGQLLSMYSDYVPEVHVSNSRTLTPDQGKARALEAASDRGPEPKRAEGGYPVIWADRTASVSGGGTTGFHAYEYLVQGQKIVVDAATGKVLSRENRRIE